MDGETPADAERSLRVRVGLVFSGSRLRDAEEIRLVGLGERAH